MLTAGCIDAILAVIPLPSRDESTADCLVAFFLKTNTARFFWRAQIDDIDTADERVTQDG